MDAGFDKCNHVISRSANLFVTASTVLPLVNVAQTITSHRLLKNSFRLSLNSILWMIVTLNANHRAANIEDNANITTICRRLA